MTNASEPSRRSEAPSRGGAMSGLAIGVLAFVVPATLGLACGTGTLAALVLGIGCALLQVLFLRDALVRQRQVVTASVRAASVELQRQAEARALSTELSLDRVCSVIDALREGVVVVDVAGEVVLANAAAERALAEPRRPVAGRPLWEVLEPELAGSARDAWQSLAAADRRDADQQVRVTALACRSRIFDLTAVPVRSRSTGQDFGSVFLLVDVTRNHELSRLKDQFLSSISHELRTPLTNICAYAEILRHMLPGESAEWPEFVRVIHEEGLSLSRLVDAVFDFLQLESGEAVFHLQPTDVTALATKVAGKAAQQAAAAGIDFACEVRGTPPTVAVDEKRLQQVCSQLLDNSIKFTPPGGRVRMLVGEQDGCWLLRVEDSGPGVPHQHRAAVFEKFHQLQDHLTDKPAGAGLGLASCRAIVSRLGGMIWCEDSSLGGAGFVVLLPPLGQRRLIPTDGAAAADKAADAALPLAR